MRERLIDRIWSRSVVVRRSRGLRRAPSGCDITRARPHLHTGTVHFDGDVVEFAVRRCAPIKADEIVQATFAIDVLDAVPRIVRADDGAPTGQHAQVVGARENDWRSRCEAAVGRENLVGRCRAGLHPPQVEGINGDVRGLQFAPDVLGAGAISEQQAHVRGRTDTEQNLSPDGGVLKNPRDAPDHSGIRFPLPRLAWRMRAQRCHRFVQRRMISRQILVLTVGGENHGSLVAGPEPIDGPVRHGRGGASHASGNQSIVQHDDHQPMRVELIGDDIQRDDARPRRGVGRRLRRFHDRQRDDWSRFPVFQHRKIAGGQARHRLLLLVEDRYIKLNDVDARVECRRSRRGLAREEDDGADAERTDRRKDRAAHEYGQLEITISVLQIRGPRACAVRANRNGRGIPRTGRSSRHTGDLRNYGKMRPIQEETSMLFHVTWRFVNHSEATAKRTLHLLSKWTPGPGHFQAFYGFADGDGGFAIVEAATAADLAKTVAPWTPLLKFDIRAILPVQEAGKINSDAVAWRDAQ